MQTDRVAGYKRGLFAETVSVLCLRLKGYKILARRYRTPVGEIDIIARRRGVVAFIEVKARRSPAQALESLTPIMRNRIVRAAGFYMQGHPHGAAMTMRFDLIACAPPFFWRHLDNAWQPPT